MTPAELRTVHDALLRAREEVLAAGTLEIAVEDDSPVASSRDEDDSPLVEMSQVINSSRNRERAERLSQIDEALRRLTEEPEEYGLCEGCGEPIPPRRLALKPFATLCVPCQSAEEKDPHGAKRRKVTDYL